MDVTISAKEHQLLLDAIKDHAIFMMDTNGMIISWNEGAKRLKGFDEEDVLGQHFRMLFLPEDRAAGKPEHELREALETGKSEEEWWRLRKDGSRFWAHVILQPVFDDGGTHIGFAKITTDRTEQKRMDELNGFLMNEPAGYAIFLLDRQGRVAQWSRAAETLTGFSEAEALGRPLADFYVSDGNEPLHQLVERQLAAAAASRHEEEAWKRRKDGTYFWAVTVLSPLHNGNGFVVLWRDLTEKRSFEQAARANAALEASNKELERFAYVASHDLNEPLRKISIFCNMLEADNPKQADLIAKITAACTRAKSLIGDILHLSLLAHTKTFATTDLNLVLRNVVDSLQEQIREKEARIESSPLPAIAVIPSQIEQLFQNLVSNAIKFCCPDNQSPLVQVRGTVLPRAALPGELREALRPSDEYLRLEVQDNGIGFQQAQSANIFELFTRLHNKSEYEGTGVGLAICKKVAESHGGHITAFSEKGKGTLFVVTLPMSQPEEDRELQVA